MAETDSHPTIALVGNPNSGKTTLFNALTGKHEKVGNYGGVTVGVHEGEFFTPHGRQMRVVDLPGCYTLEAKSPEEQVTIDCLKASGEERQSPDLVLCVVDASNLERHLLLAFEVIELGLPVLIALNMVDVAEKSGIRLDPATLSEELGVSVVPMQANSGKGILECKQAVRPPFPSVSKPRWLDQASGTPDSKREFIHELCTRCARRPEGSEASLSDKIDRWLLHPIFGWAFFVTVLFGIFWAIFSLAGIPMGWIEALQDWVSGIVASTMSEGDLQSLLIDGVIGGVGGVVIFLPQILFLFLFIGLLESSGYMARAAFLMDGLMSRVGLSGKAFLPLLSSYACAIPGVMATRTIDSAKERLVTIFIAPWMSCAARLPVYFLIVPLLLNEKEGTWKQALLLFGIYAVGTATAFVVARVLRGKLGADPVKSHFLLELPPYRPPQWSFIIRHVVDRGLAFLAKAGTTILGISILLWALTTYPKPPAEEEIDPLSYSAMGRIGEVIEPVVKPLGFDGRIGTAVLTSFAAREVFNSSLSVMFRVDETDDDVETRNRIREKIASAEWEDGSKLFTPLTSVSILVFFIYALQCLPTSVVVAREARSRKWAVGQFFFMSAFAYSASLLVYQGGKLIGF